MAISIGVFFSLLISGLHATLPQPCRRVRGPWRTHADVANHVASLPPVSTVFAAFLGFNPIQNLLDSSGILHQLPTHAVDILTGKQFFPHLISAPFHRGLVIVFTTAALLALFCAMVSLRQTGSHKNTRLSTSAARPKAPLQNPPSQRSNPPRSHGRGGPVDIAPVEGRQRGTRRGAT